MNSKKWVSWILALGFAMPSMTAFGTELDPVYIYTQKSEEDAWAGDTSEGEQNPEEAINEDSAEEYAAEENAPPEVIEGPRCRNGEQPTYIGVDEPHSCRWSNSSRLWVELVVAAKNLPIPQSGIPDPAALAEANAILKLLMEKYGSNMGKLFEGASKYLDMGDFIETVPELKEPYQRWSGKSLQPLTLSNMLMNSGFLFLALYGDELASKLGYESPAEILNSSWGVSWTTRKYECRQSLDASGNPETGTIKVSSGNTLGGFTGAPACLTPDSTGFKWENLPPTGPPPSLKFM